MMQQEGSLTIVAHAAMEMPNVETFGKQDPYLQFSLNLNDKSSWQKSHTQKDAGKNATWNQSFEIPLRGEPELYVEVMDEETGVDELIGFAAIPIAPVAQAPGGYVNGLFDLYTVKGKSGGVLHLSLTVRGFNSPPPAYGQYDQPVRGHSYVNEEHLNRCKSLRNKAIAGDIGTAVLGGALAIGAGFLGHKLYQEHERREQEEEEMELEKQRMEEERERLEREREEMEREREEMERCRQEEEQQEEEEREECEEEHHCHHEDQCNEEEGGYGGYGDAAEWDPIGTYAPGDRVEYHGHTYICLQGHTSNPTWMPGAAHSLWQPE